MPSQEDDAIRKILFVDAEVVGGAPVGRHSTRNYIVLLCSCGGKHIQPPLSLLSQINVGRE